MGNPKGFMSIKRQEAGYRPVCERVKDYESVALKRGDSRSQEQASRCMDCGTPFCHWACPVGNYIPEWNDLVMQAHWQKAFELLDATNNFPEITGRLCPAFCEYSCVLGINDNPITIRENELAIIEHAFKKGFIKSRIPLKRTSKKVAVIGSGPSGLAAASQLNRAGHFVRVYEKDAKIGGILRYGIPDFKLEKHIIDRRVELMKNEGIDFVTSCNVGVDVSAEKLLTEYDAICLSMGSRVPRDLAIKGRDLSGIYFAMDYLIQSNQRVSGEKKKFERVIDAKGKKVVVIGGGDTGADCVGTSHRQGATCVIQIELLDKPPECRTEDYPWPKYPLLLKTSSSHEEGGERHWSVLTKEFIGENGHVKKISCSRVKFEKSGEGTCPVMKEIPDSMFEIEADLVILAVGFLYPEHEGLVTELGVKFDEKGLVKSDANYMTSKDKVFCAGDMRRGQSLVVWAISEGRRAAYSIDKFLMGESSLPNI